jgi:hypothetical protein
VAIINKTPPFPERESAESRGHEPTGDPYIDLPWDGPHAPVLGHALITTVEPHEGHEHAYNRWYEDSHFFNGALQHPWMTTGRRWVATRDLQLMRYPNPSPVASPVTAGAYLGTYWVTHGRVDEHKKWTGASNAYLVSVGDVVRERTHIFTSFQDRVASVYVDDTVPHDMFALHDPSPGLVLQTIDAPSAESRADLEQWLSDTYVPSRVSADGPVWSAIIWQVTPPFPAMKPEVYAALKHVANEGRRLTVLWFLREDPRDCWDHFTGESERIDPTGLGTVTLVAPFIPAKMGTTLYEDQLRD